MTATDPVLTHHEDGIAVLTINRPDVRNALSSDVLDALDALLDELADDAATGVVILTGAGEKSFAAGADISQLAGRVTRDGMRARMQRLYDKLAALPQPTIAAVNGFALGGGCELALACDIRIAAQGARFGQPEVGLGIIPAAGGTQRLQRLVGLGRATELILTGRVIDAAEALSAGLVTAVVPGSDLLDEARQTARTILSKGPTAIRLAKLVVAGGADTDLHTGQLLERLAQSLLYTIDEKNEGTTAFLDKRTPAFGPPAL